MENRFKKGNIIVYFDPDNWEYYLNICDGYDDVTLTKEDFENLLSILDEIRKEE